MQTASQTLQAKMNIFSATINEPSKALSSNNFCSNDCFPRDTFQINATLETLRAIPIGTPWQNCKIDQLLIITKTLFIWEKRKIKTAKQVWRHGDTYQKLACFVLNHFYPSIVDKDVVVHWGATALSQSHFSTYITPLQCACVLCCPIIRQVP